MNFLYHGEANVFQENLESFLAIGEELQLRGLVGKTEDKLKDLEEDEKPSFNTTAKIPKRSFKRQKSENTTVAIPGNFSGDLDELDEKSKINDGEKPKQSCWQK